MVKSKRIVNLATEESVTAAAGMALDFIRNGICDCAVVGGVDSLSIIAAYGFNALKSMSGASGVVELISVILSMQYGKYIPLPNLKNTIDDSYNIKMSDKTFDTDIEYSLSNSFAFDGNSASVVVKKYHGGEAE